MESHCSWCEKEGQPSFLKLVPGPVGEKTARHLPAAFRGDARAARGHGAGSRRESRMIGPRRARVGLAALAWILWAGQGDGTWTKHPETFLSWGACDRAGQAQRLTLGTGAIFAGAIVSRQAPYTCVRQLEIHTPEERPANS